MIILYVPAAVYAMFLLYVLAMGFKRAWPKMSLFEKTLAALPIVIGTLLDWVLNMIPMSIFFGDLPKAWDELMTIRFKRYKYGPDSRRRRVALKICRSLDKFDPDGDHC